MSKRPIYPLIGAGIMPVTKSFVSKHLTPPLVGIVMEYATSKYRKNFIDIAEVGEYETCMDARSYVDLYDVFLGGCRGGHVEIMNLGLKCKEIKYFENGCSQACFNGHLEIVKLLISRGANKIKSHIPFACLGQHIDIVKFLISRGFDDWNYGLYEACCGGSQELVDLMISRGANDWNRGLYGACVGDNIELVKLFISYGATNFNDCLYIACAHEKQDIVRLLVTAGATECSRCFRPINEHV